MRNDSQPLDWHTEKRLVKDLIPYEFNPRTLTEDKKQKLIDSIEKFNLVEIPVINLDNTIIAGHQRIIIMGVLERENEIIDVRVPNRQLTELELKEYNLRSNISIGDWVADMLKENFDDIDLFDIGLDINIDELIEEQLKSVENAIEVEAVEDDYEEPEDLKVDVVLGDLITFEKNGVEQHRLLCGSSTEADNWAKLMGGELADMVETDPPYNVDYTGKTKDSLKIENDKKDNDSFYQFLYDFYSILGSYTKEGGAWYVWHADSEGANFRQAMKDSGLYVKQCLIWVKNSLVFGRQDYHWQHEPCLYGWKPGAPHKWYSDRKQTTVLNFDRPFRSTEHPTMKPIPLISYQIKNSSKISDIVADGFLGSGTTMVASHQLKRKCYGMELGERYCQVIIDRMIKLDTEIVVKINGKKYN